MAAFALYAQLKAKPGKESQVESLLMSARGMVEKEPGTITWYAFEEDNGAYGIFDTFQSESARQAHLDGPIAKTLMDNASELFTQPPAIHKIRLLAAKIPGD